MTENVRFRRLGRLEFDTSTLALVHNGALVALSPKCARLLRMLVDADGAVVKTSEIFEALWPDGCVEQGNLNQTIYVLRSALAREPGVKVENVSRRGYRLRCDGDRDVSLRDAV